MVLVTRGEVKEKTVFSGQWRWQSAVAVGNGSGSRQWLSKAEAASNDSALINNTV